MKKIALIGCLLVGLITVGHAQIAHSVTDPEEKAKDLQKQLTLTNDQTTKVAAIYKESAESYQKIKSAAHGNADKLTKSSLSLRAATIKKIQGVLTPTQAGKFNGMTKKTKKNSDNDWGEGWTA